MPYRRKGGPKVQVQLDHYTHGAAVATELVNTTTEVQTSTGDTLGDLDALVRFLRTHDVAVTARPAARDVRGVHELRAGLRAALDAPDTVGRLVVAVGRGPVLRPDPTGRLQWWATTAPGASVVDELTLLTGTALLGVLRALGPDRFRPCASPTCRGAFVDASRAGRRRYCVPAVCGNRVHVAAHRARRRADDRPSRQARSGDS